jgi:hypothetical protein
MFGTVPSKGSLRVRGRQRLLTCAVGISALAVVLSIAVTSGASPSGPVDAQVRTVSSSGLTETVDVGDVIAVGEKTGELCEFDEPIDVEVVVQGSDVGPDVTWSINQSCEAVVDDIEPGTATLEPTPESRTVQATPDPLGSD